MKKTKKDNTEKTVEEFEREAKERIAARKEHPDTLMDYYDSLIVKSSAVIKAYEKSRPFYRNGTHVSIDTLVFQVMDNGGDPLGLWCDLSSIPLSAQEESPPTKEQHQAIVYTTRRFLGILCELANLSFDENIKFFPEVWWTEKGQRDLEFFYYVLLFLVLHGSAFEITMAITHFEKWKKEWEECRIPVDFRTIDNSPSKMLKAWSSVVDAVFKHESFLSVLDSIDRIAFMDFKNAPIAFFCKEPGRYSDDELRVSVRNSLVFAEKLGLFHNKNDVKWYPVKAINDLFYNFICTLREYFGYSRFRCKPDSKASRKWLEAETELNTYVCFTTDPLTPEVADHIIALADDAARESWIEEESKKKCILDIFKEMDEATDRKPLQTPPTVRLADDQLAQITKGQSTIKKEVNVVKQLARGEYTKKNEKTPERQRSVDCAKKHYYRILNEGIVKPHNAITAACRAADKEMKTSFGTYKTEGCFTEALRRVIDARNAHYGAKAADPNLPNP